MAALIHLFILFPLLGFLISIFVHVKREALLSRIAFFTPAVQLISFLLFFVHWILNGHETISIKDFPLFVSGGFEFYFDLYFDKITAVYLFVGALLTFLVTIYSRYYLHRESGYKRFFNTILFFYLGYNLVILSGNFETLFLGWEILGISSYLLIAFYRDRYLPAKNALKVFSIYRLGDIGFILVMWMNHNLWHENVTFLEINNRELVHEHLVNHSVIGAMIALLIMITALAKSAQLPFSAWLPRAMEGPTPSSAIFYGSLSVHIGVFILLRTFPFWENQISVRILLAAIGFLTFLVTSGIARVQSSIKSLVAYSSISQIGLIFMEVAAGWENIALLHFAGNAFLRTYQLLVSPSVVSYLIQDQFYNFVPRKKTIEDYVAKKLQFTFFIVSLKEWSLDGLMFRLWAPLKWVGRRIPVDTFNKVILIIVPAYVISLGLFLMEGSISKELYARLPVIYSFIGFILVLKSFTLRENVLLAWTLIIINDLWIVLAVFFNAAFTVDQALVYLSGIVISGIVGALCLTRLIKLEGSIDLILFQGHQYEHPKIAFIFLLSCLGLMGFPVTPTFIGEDLLFGHILQEQVLLAYFAGMSFIIGGISVIRIYSRVFLGPHIKSYHEKAYRSS